MVWFLNHTLNHKKLCVSRSTVFFQPTLNANAEHRTACRLFKLLLTVTAIAVVKTDALR